MPGEYYRFKFSIGYITHLWKSTARQDHASWRPILQRLLSADGVAIDVGAHGGQVTRLLSRLIPQGTVVAVEPSSYARSVLRPALWLRGVKNVVVVAAALGETPGTALLRTPIKRRGDMGYGLATISPTDSHAHVAEPVAVMTLDALVKALALSRVDFVKADIEGHEAALIAGAGETLRRYRPSLLLEHDATFLARAGASPGALWAELTSLGYQPHSIVDGVTVPIAAGNGPEQGDVLWLPIT